MKKVIISTGLFGAALIFSIVVLLLNDQIQASKNGVENPPDGTEGQIILFYGQGCPACAQVEKYIKENQIESKISLIQKEVYYNKNNAKELRTKAKICGLGTQSVPIPFLWDGSKCLTGVQPIIDFLGTASTIQNNINAENP